MVNTEQATETALANVRQAVRDQLGTDTPDLQIATLDEVTRFSAQVPAHYAGQERSALAAQVHALRPWLQGPFYLGGDLAIGGAWRNDLRWKLLAAALPPSLAGMRVLDIGCNAGYDCFAFNLLGPALTVGIDPEIFIEQAYFLNTIYRTPVRFEKIGWQDLDPETHGLFDIVHCNGVYYHEQAMVHLIRQLARVTAPGGTMYIGGFILDDPAFSDYARFVPGSFWNDPTWWWVPGSNCLRTMVESVGFESVQEFGRAEVPNGDFPVSSVYVSAVRKRS